MSVIDVKCVNYSGQQCIKNVEAASQANQQAEIIVCCLCGSELTNQNSESNAVKVVSDILDVLDGIVGVFKG